MFYRVSAFVALVLMVATTASAQVQHRKGWLDVNAGIANSAQADLTTSVSYADGSGESEFYQVDYRSPTGASFDFGGGFMITPKVGVGISFGGTAHQDTADLTIRIPHPFYFNRFASDTSETDGTLQKTEGAAHFQFVLQLVDSGKARVRVFAGPTYFQLKSDAISDITYDQVYYLQLNEVAIKTYDTEEVEASAWGFHVGGDISVFFTRVFGLGAFARFSKWTVTVEDDRILSADGPVDVKVGGFQAGAGLRFRF
jgi:hypothetical protein